MYRLLGPLCDRTSLRIKTYYGELESLVELDQTLQALRSLQNFEENWDGEGAVAFKDSTIANAADIVVFVSSQRLPGPDVSPNPHGTVAMEWENSQGYAYVEVGSAQLTALIKTSDRNLIFSLDRVDATNPEYRNALAFYLRSILYPNADEVIGYAGTSDTAHKWLAPSFDAMNISNQPWVVPYAITAAN